MKMRKKFVTLKGFSKILNVISDFCKEKIE